MALYERLNPDMRRTVDEFAARIRDLPWPRKSDLLAEAVVPFADRFGGDEARLASMGFLTAVIERLGPEEVNDPHQACLLYLSLNPEHRIMADLYLVDHPELRQLLDVDEDDLDGDEAPADEPDEPVN